MVSVGQEFKQDIVKILVLFGDTWTLLHLGWNCQEATLLKGLPVVAGCQLNI